MRKVKRGLMRLFFVLEVGIFVWGYLFGAQGIMVLRHLDRENMQLEQSIQLLREENRQFEKRIAGCTADAFYKEKIARERLQMARRGDQIYYVDR